MKIQDKDITEKIFEIRRIAVALKDSRFSADSGCHLTLLEIVDTISLLYLSNNLGAVNQDMIDKKIEYAYRTMKMYESEFGIL